MLLSRSELKREYFKNGTEAHSSSIAKGGWIPDWLPSDATEIHIQYDLDTNYRWMKFRLENKSKETFISNFKEISWENAKNYIESSPRGADWWFRGVIQEQPENGAALNAYFYVGDGTIVSKKIYLAVSKSDDSLYCWIPGS